jgi:hypothetical protein
MPLDFHSCQGSHHNAPSITQVDAQVSTQIAQNDGDGVRADWRSAALIWAGVQAGLSGA